MTDDLRLLHEYLHQGSRAALDQLVRQNLDMVYSAACRQVADPHLAEDVTQAVFLVLAKKAGTIRRGVAVAGWLLAVTRCASLDAMRKKSIRQKHERAASIAETKDVACDDWAEIAPLLDGELNRLGTRDRDAVVLRFFKDRSFAQIGAELEMTPDAARKRVERAIKRLRGLLARRGVAAPATAIGGAIAAFAVQSAPSHLAAAVASSGVPATKTVSLARGVIKMMPWAKLKVAELVAMMALLIGGSGAAILNQLMAAEPATPAPSTAPAPASVVPAAVDYPAPVKSPFLELVGCHIKQSVVLHLAATNGSVEDVDWSDCQYDQVRWTIDPALADHVAGYTILASSVDQPGSVTTFHADKKADTQSLKQALPKAGNYVVKVTANDGDGKSIASASANVTINPLPFTQVLISDYRLDGLIYCNYVLQHMNDSGAAITGDDMDYDDSANVTEMFDELGSPLKIKITHKGHTFLLNYRLNNPVEPGEPFMVSNLSTMDGLTTKVVRDLGGGEYAATFKQFNGQSTDIRRIELHILPAGAKLESVKPDDLPSKVVDGRVQVFIDKIIPRGRSITSTFRYKLADGN